MLINFNLFHSTNVFSNIKEAITWVTMAAFDPSWLFYLNIYDCLKLQNLFKDLIIKESFLINIEKLSVF